jgi:hypothetical protein
MDLASQLSTTDRDVWMSELENYFDLESGELDMFVMEIPDSAAPQESIVLARAEQTDTARKERTIGVCMDAQNPESGSNNWNYLSPDISARTYFREYEKSKYVKNPVFGKLELVQAPKHGTLTIYKSDDGSGEYAVYIPNKNFLKADKATLRISVNGIPVKVVYRFEVTREGFDQKNQEMRCPRLTDFWKISLPTTGQTSDLATALTAASQNLTFVDLTGSAVGETLGTGPIAQITLDTTAAGHGWYIDYTPYLNDEYLPTSNPLEWIAKPGSEAEGKMDLLTVLLHEYGHALGLDHSADSHDLMATTLLPGVRRLPSAEELDLMAQLLGVAKETGSASPVPYNPFSPPGTPLPATISLAAFVAARQRRSSLSSSLTQFEVAANPTLTNPQFADSQGWSTGGDVAITAGTATLKETATTQTRLNQAFVIKPSDRFLSFTLSGIALDDVSNAPDDAFEVALIDVNTGLSLLGGTGLSRNDAFLNLQADGTEYKASGVTTVTNADGSRTVLVDLAGIAAGTVVNLSFDLIGFGRGAAATSSHVTVKDLRIGVPQEAHDDTATLAEDTTQDIDVVANDIGVDQPGVLPVLVNGSAHGTVELTAEGRFRYIPDANWSGEDSFSYALKEIPLKNRLSDGNLDSNIAEVKR